MNKALLQETNMLFVSVRGGAQCINDHHNRVIIILHDNACLYYNIEDIIKKILEYINSCVPMFVV